MPGTAVLHSRFSLEIVIGGTPDFGESGDIRDVWLAVPRSGWIGRETGSQVHSSGPSAEPSDPATPVARRLQGDIRHLLDTCGRSLAEWNASMGLYSSWV